MASIHTVKIIRKDNMEYLESPYTEFFYLLDDQSYKRWSFKKSTQNWKNGKWQSHDMVFDIFSTGKVCLCGKIVLNSDMVTLNWKIELLGIDKNVLHTLHFAPIIFNNPVYGKPRRVNFQKRSRKIDIDLIPSVVYARFIPG